MSSETDPHLSAEALAGYVDDALPAGERVRVEAHLDACEHCRAEFIDAGRLTRKRPVPSRRRRWALVPLVAASTLLIVTQWRAPRADDDAGVALRAEGEDTREPAVRFEATTPVDASVHTAVPTAFAWHTAGVGATYRVTLADAAGATLWVTATTDTMATVPKALALAAGTYYWYVDAQRTDGVSTSTGARRFTVR